MFQLKKIAPKESAIQIPFASQLKIAVYQLDTRRYISKNHYLIITNVTVSLPESLLVVLLGKALNRMPPSLWANRWWGQAVYTLWLPSLTKDMQTEHELKRMNK